MGKFSWLQSELRHLRSSDLLRIPLCIDSCQGPIVTVSGEEKLLFCSNNYLSLANHPSIIKAVESGVRRFGYGASASRLISGTMLPHIELERSLAELFEKPAALVFGSGFTANQALIKTIPQKGDLLLLDKLDHASIMDAAQNCSADFRTFHRGDYRRMERLLAGDRYDRKFIITESIFSMDGDFADLSGLIDLRNRYGAILVVDEAHAMGCLGRSGAGLAQQLGLLGQIDIIVSTLSKAVGCTGGVIAGERVVIDYLINKSGGFIYTTAPTAVNCVAAKAAVEIFRTQPSLRERLSENAEFLRRRLRDFGLNIGRTRSHIIPIMIGDNRKALELSAKLFAAGFIVIAIRPPTVPPGTARLRLSVQCDHTQEQINSLCEAIKKFF